MFHFRKKVAIVTGGGSGIGKAISLELGRRGARVVVADVSMARAAEVVAQIESEKGSARAVELDIEKTGSLQALVEAVMADEKRIDFMFNSAGSFFDDPSRMQSVDELRHRIDISEWSVVSGTTAAYQVMLRQGFGHIINTSSVSSGSQTSFSSVQSIAGYAVSVFSTTLRGESANLGVKVSVVCPSDHARRSEVKHAAPLVLAKTILRGVERNQAFIPVDAPAVIAG